MPSKELYEYLKMCIINIGTTNFHDDKITFIFVSNEFTAAQLIITKGGREFC